MLSWNPGGGGILTAVANGRPAHSDGDDARKIISTLDEVSITKLTRKKNRKPVSVKKIMVKAVGNAFVIVGVNAD